MQIPDAIKLSHLPNHKITTLIRTAFRKMWVMLAATVPALAAEPAQTGSTTPTDAGFKPPLLGLEEVGHRDVRLEGGFWGPRLERHHRTTIPHVLDNPHFPALLSDSMALSGASRRKQTPSSFPPGRGRGKTWMKPRKTGQFHKSSSGWTREDVINLTNKEGLPASPFRTDRD